MSQIIPAHRSSGFLHIRGISLYAAFIEPENEAGLANPTLVFLHDSLGCTELWRDFPQKVAEQTHCPVMIYDRQGYGRSEAFGPESRTQRYMETEAEILAEILEYRKTGPAILFGHSDGGSIALMAAAKFPALIKGVITEGAHVFVEDITLQGIRAAVNLYATTNLKEKLSRYHGEKTDAVFHAWADTWLKPEYHSWNIEHFLPQIVCPSLIIQGVNDEYGSEKQVDAIVQAAKGPAQKYMVNGAAHTPHKEAPQETLVKTVAFIRSLL